MVVAQLLGWKSPAVLILVMVMLGHSPTVVRTPDIPNDFVEVFAGDAAVTLACWNRGLVGSCHDVRYTSLMDLTSTHGFLFLGLHMFAFKIAVKSVNHLSIVSLNWEPYLSLQYSFLRLVCREIWNMKPGGLCLFGICCNSFTKMCLGCILWLMFSDSKHSIIILAVLAACQVMPHFRARCVQPVPWEYGVQVRVSWELVLCPASSSHFSMLCKRHKICGGAAGRQHVSYAPTISASAGNWTCVLAKHFYRVI